MFPDRGRVRADGVHCARHSDRAGRPRARACRPSRCLLQSQGQFHTTIKTLTLQQPLSYTTRFHVAHPHDIIKTFFIVYICDDNCKCQIQMHNCQRKPLTLSNNERYHDNLVVRS